MKKFKLFSLLLIALSGAFIFAGCDNKGDIIAVVNGDNIYESEFDNMVSGLYTAQGSEATDEQKQQVYDSLITSKLVEQECETQNLSVTDQDIEDYITSIATTNGLFNSEFYSQLKDAYGYSEDFVNSLVKSSLEEEALYNYVTSSVAELDDAGYKALYDADPSKYKEVQVSHILISVDDTTAKAKALDLITQLNSGADFAALAEANSDDSGTASDGGALSGYITSDNTTYVEEFVQGAMSLNATGEYTTEPVKSEYGYHIIKADSVLATYDELKDYIKTTVDNTNKNDAYTTYINNLKENAEIDERMTFNE